MKKTLQEIRGRRSKVWDYIAENLYASEFSVNELKSHLDFSSKEIGSDLRRFREDGILFEVAKKGVSVFELGNYRGPNRYIVAPTASAFLRVEALSDRHMTYEEAVRKVKGL